MKAQKELILNHFAKKKSITSWEAIQKYNITRLAAVIFELKSHHRIMTVIEKADNKRWAKYVYMGEK